MEWPAVWYLRGTYIARLLYCGVAGGMYALIGHLAHFRLASINSGFHRKGSDVNYRKRTWEVTSNGMNSYSCLATSNRSCGEGVGCAYKMDHNFGLTKINASLQTVCFNSG